MKDKKRLFLIDGSALAYRSYFAFIRNPLINSKGENTSAPYGFASSLMKILKEEEPDYIGVVFDTKAPTFRHEIYKEYKSTRAKMPEEMVAQLPRIMELITAMNIPILEMDGFEADDLMGTLARRAKDKGLEVILVTGDKDFLQLVDEDIKVLNPRKSGEEIEIYDGEKVKEKFGVPPEKVTDLLGLMGDASDNVPGIPGVGEKTALELIQQFGDLENVLANADKVKKKNISQNLKEHSDLARLSKKLVTIETSVPFELDINSLSRREFNLPELKELFKELEFTKFLQEITSREAQDKTRYLTIEKEEEIKEILRICVPLNPDIEPSNLEYIISQSTPGYIFIHANLAGKYDIKKLNTISELDFLATQKDINLSQHDITFDPERCAEIIFTSGSTGTPKGVMISHKNIIANTNSILEYLKLRKEDIIEVVMPFYYCYGLSLLHTHLRVGGSLVLNNTFVFLGSVLNDLNKYQCTGFAGVPSHFQILLRKSQSFKKTKFPHLHYVTQAGGKLHDVFIKEFIESHPEINFYIMYGQTEATARLSYLPPEKLKDKLGSIGKGIPGVELKLVNETGKTINPGELGEIIACGENIMIGYINDQKSTGETVKNGWLHTGDIGTIDEEGYIFIKSRQKEIIKVGGKRISPKEIEEVIVTIPEVIDCTISSIEDELMGEAIKAIITVDRSNYAKLNVEYIKHICAEKLASFKIPQVIEILDKVTISPTGKKIKT